MSLGFDIASLSLGVVQIGAKIAHPFARAQTKAGAQQSYDEAVQQFSLMKELRDNILVNQYLSKFEKAELDSTIEILVFSLMDLERALERVKTISYWKIRSYPAELQSFNESRAAFIEGVAGVRREIHTRSSQGRSRTNSNSIAGTMPMESAEARPHPTASRVISTSDGDPNNDSDTRRNILDALEVAAASSIRSAVEAVDPNYRGTAPPVENRLSRGAPVLTSFVVSPIGVKRPTAANSENPWHVPARPGSALSFISHSANIELEVFGEVSADVD